MEELRHNIWNKLLKLYGAGLADYRDNANQPSCRASNIADEIITLLQSYLKENNYVQLDDDQSLPEFDYELYLIGYTNFRFIQDKMIEAGFKKIKQ